MNLVLFLLNELDSIVRISCYCQVSSKSSFNSALRGVHATVSVGGGSEVTRASKVFAALFNSASSRFFFASRFFLRRSAFFLTADFLGVLHDLGGRFSCFADDIVFLASTRTFCWFFLLLLLLFSKRIASR